MANGLQPPTSNNAYEKGGMAAAVCQVLIAVWEIQTTLAKCASIFDCFLLVCFRTDQDELHETRRGWVLLLLQRPDDVQEHRSQLQAPRELRR